jgi:O-antigen/teichoic acid export membrane protein
MCIGGSILSEKLIIFMYGRDFIGSIDALKILIWTLLFIFTNYILGMTLNSINKQNINTINTLICVIVNIVLNSILIPLVGYIGAAIATVFTEATLTFLGIINLKKVLKDIKIVEKSLIRTIFAAIVMGLVVLIMQNYINVIVNIVVGSIIYILFLGLLRELRKEDIYTIASIIRGKFYE